MPAYSMPQLPKNKIIHKYKPSSTKTYIVDKTFQTINQMFL